MDVIKTEELTYTYSGKKKPSIIDVSIQIKKGDFTIITGPSGCGKTTLCRCFNGLIPHFYQGNYQGKTIIIGEKVTDHPIHKLAKKVGLLFQNPENQLFALSAEKDVAFGLENLGVPREEMRKRVNWALDITDIDDLKDRSPHELSGGQQQRVAIASIIAMKPEIMVLDEPTSFLDPVSAKKIFEVIHKLNKDHKITVVLVEHRLDLTARYANHIIVMNEGKIVLDGLPKEVLSDERTHLLGVGIPKTTQLYQLLKNDGVKLGKNIPLTPFEMAKILKRVFHK